MRRQPVAAALVVLLAVVAFVAPASAADGADLSVAIRGPEATPKVGESFDVRIKVTNSGTQGAEEAGLGVYFGNSARLNGLELSDPTDSCTEEYPGEQRCDLGTVAPATSSTFTLHLTRLMARDMWIDAWVFSTTTDYDEDNYAGIQIGPDTSVKADVAVTASAPNNPDLGETFDTKFKVANFGPGRAKDVLMTVSLPEANTYLGTTSSDNNDTCTLHEETYDEEGLEGGPYVYRYLECRLGTLTFAEGATITVSQVRDNAYGLWSSAYVETSSYDDNWDNDWADLHIPGHPSVTSDLGATVQAPASAPLVGEGYEAVFTVSNGGPAVAPDAGFGTYVPYGFELDSVSSSTGTCTEDQWGGVECTLGELDPGSAATVILSLTRTNPREAWLSGWSYSSNYDSNYENDYAEVAIAPDTSNPADIGVDLDGPVDPEVGSNYTTTATVVNNGPQTASSVMLHEAVPEGATFVSAVSSDATDSCELFEESYDDDYDADGVIDETYTYREIRCSLGDLAVGESAQIDVVLTRDAEWVLWSSAWVETGSYDGNYDNDWAEWNSSGEYPDYECYEGEGVGERKSVSCDYATGGGGASAGRDSLEFAAAGGGDSEVSAGGGDDELVVTVPTGGQAGRRVTVNAGRGDDDITVKLAPGVTNAVIVVRGGAGNDSIDIEAPHAGKGIKIIVKAGRGKDVVLGGSGNDRIWGGRGRDHIEGAAGNDRMAGGMGRDTCIGGPGRDKRIGC